MTTAIQDLLSFIDILPINNSVTEIIKNKAKELLEKEKEIIIHAYSEGFNDGYTDDDTYDSSNDYYNNLVTNYPFS